jgi:bifunctional UDP-N-acetylglucosamine pyrophosphorylase/glucosamine-1-phosphate N-acetyltransferase
MDSEWGRALTAAQAPILILPGDTPLLSASLMTAMLEPMSRSAALRLLVTEIPDPTGYGRVVRRGKSGPVLRIVEERDSSAREKAIREVAMSIYLFQSAFLSSTLAKLSNKNAQGEFYLTDLVATAARARKRIEVLKWAEPADLQGINDPYELAVAGRALNGRILKEHARKGVKILDLDSVWIDAQVSLAEGVTIHPGAILSGATTVESGATIGPRVVLKNVKVGARANIKTGTVAEDSVIGPDAQVGPYAHFRPESQVGQGAKIGNFVELKKTRIGDHTNVAHLSYLGDAEVGSRVNIGCGFVTCNFDGRVIEGQRKHRTTIEDDVFLGSDCQAVAPVRIGRGAYIASGSTITEDVPAEALAIARSRQVNKPGYARKLREGK